MPTSIVSEAIEVSKLTGAKVVLLTTKFPPDWLRIRLSLASVAFHSYAVGLDMV